MKKIFLLFIMLIVCAFGVFASGEWLREGADSQGSQKAAYINDGWDYPVANLSVIGGYSDSNIQPLMYDIDSDGINELFSTKSGTLYIIKYTNYSFRILAEKYIGGIGLTFTITPDINSDGIKDILTLSNSGTDVIFTTWAFNYSDSSLFQIATHTFTGNYFQTTPSCYTFNDGDYCYTLVTPTAGTGNGIFGVKLSDMNTYDYSGQINCGTGTQFIVPADKVFAPIYGNVNGDNQIEIAIPVHDLTQGEAYAFSTHNSAAFACKIFYQPPYNYADFHIRSFSVINYDGGYDDYMIGGKYSYGCYAPRNCSSYVYLYNGLTFKNSIVFESAASGATTDISNVFYDQFCEQRTTPDIAEICALTYNTASSFCGGACVAMKCARPTEFNSFGLGGILAPVNSFINFDKTSISGFFTTQTIKPMSIASGSNILTIPQSTACELPAGLHSSSFSAIDLNGSLGQSSAVMSVGDVNGDEIADFCASYGGYLQCFFVTTFNLPPYIVGRYGADIKITDGNTRDIFLTDVCVDSVNNFFAKECDSARHENCNYINDFIADSERLVTDCGTGTNIFGNYSLNSPTIQCNFNRTGDFIFPVYIQDRINSDNFARFINIHLSVVNGTEGFTCNLPVSVIDITPQNQTNIINPEGSENVTLPSPALFGTRSEFEPCNKGTECYSGTCEYHQCALSGFRKPCFNDNQCLSNQCRYYVCNRPSYFTYLNYGRKQQFGNDTNTNNLISILLMIICAAFLSYINIIMGIVAVFVLGGFFAIIGWLSPFILLMGVITMVISVVILYLFKQGSG